MTGQIALRATIDYMELSFAGNWSKGYLLPKLYAASIDQKFAQLKKLVRQG